MNKRGFVLIELLIASAISAVLMGSLAAWLYQAMSYQQMINTTTTEYTRLTTFNSIFARDLQGSFIPVQALDQVPTVTTKTASANQSSKNKWLKKVEDPFLLLSTSEGMLIQLTCITRNPLQGYWDGTVGKAQPRVARVVYKLEQDENKKSYILFRQQGDELFLKPYIENQNSDFRAYKLIEGIASLRIQAGYEMPEKGKETSVKLVNVWPIEDKKQSKNDVLSLPIYVRVTIALWNDVLTKQQEFSFIYPIVPYVAQTQVQNQVTSTGISPKGSNQASDGKG
jgi:prepilin-type N-terminal cleavage/methylation domain-containing protein